MNFYDLICAWNILDDSHKILLGNCLVIFGVIGLGLNIWLFIAFLRSHFLTSRSYLFLLANSIACIARGLLTFPFASLSAVLTRWLFGFAGCQLFAFLKFMAGTFQIGCFTVIAIERLVLVKYYKKGTELPFKFYIISIILCWMLSTSLATLPLVGFGKYVHDTTCTVCELDWKMVDNRQMWFNASVIIIVGVTPLLMTVICLVKAISKERKNSSRTEQNTTTKAVIVMVALTTLFWIPRAILVLWIPFIKYRIPTALAVMAPLCAEASTIIPVLTYLVYLPTLRNALLTVLAKKRRNL